MSTYEAGRELDALVAEKVMGWSQSEFGHATLYLTPPGQPRDVVRATPHYSTDIADAWMVVEKLNRPDMTLRVEWDSNRRAWVAWRADMDTIYPAATAPLAICRFAVEAKS